MHILLTGGTGLIGRSLCRLWQERGYQLTVLGRTPDRVKELCGSTIYGISRLDEIRDNPPDAVVNLAGAPIADKRWTARRKDMLRKSRIGLTRELVDWMARQSHMPQVFLSGSAVGYYGDTGEAIVDEDGLPQADDFASCLCRDWEVEAERAAALGIRVVRIRTGLVLAGKEGFMNRLLPVYRLGLGGPIGSGRQWMPWIHIKDQTALIDFLLHDPSCRGAYNACSPNPVKGRDFARALGRVLHRPAVVPLPAFMLKLIFGELSAVLLGGQHAVPKRLQEAGFHFNFTNIEEALVELLKYPRGEK